ncbi:MAG: hypothetical protein RL333_40 [Pseudomonadota bacterium]|jgi:hypothetical protein
MAPFGGSELIESVRSGPHRKDQANIAFQRPPHLLSDRRRPLCRKREFLKTRIAFAAPVYPLVF